VIPLADSIDDGDGDAALNAKLMVCWLWIEVRGFKDWLAILAPPPTLFAGIKRAVACAMGEPERILAATPSMFQKTMRRGIGSRR
jgi:hypothetical protein